MVKNINQLPKKEYSFNCKKCGYCCTLVVKTKLLELLRMWLRGYRNFTERDVNGRLAIKKVDGKCFFLEDKTCRIYDIRPKACKVFPKKSGECDVDKRDFRKVYLR